MIKDQSIRRQNIINIRAPKNKAPKIHEAKNGSIEEKQILQK